MKQLSIVFFLALFAFGCNDDKKESTATNSDVFLDNLKGGVQQITETPYKTDSTGKVGEMDSCCIGTTSYDSTGYFFKYSSKDSKGDPSFEQSITRYENKLFKEIINIDKGVPSGKITIQLDKDGQKYASAMEYDSAGKLSSFFKDINQNEFNQLTSMKQYKPDSTLKSSQETKYEKHVFVGQTSKDSSGKVTGTTTAKVDDKGNQTEVTNANTSKDTTTNKDTTITTVTKYRYDSYDDKGNWTQRTEMDDKGKATKVVKREITYYKK